MKKHSYKLFAIMCESQLMEYSTAIPILSNNPDGKSLIQFLHSRKKLAHNIRWETVPKLRWNALKQDYQGAWVIVQGRNGVGAIKSTSGDKNYEGIVVDPEDGDIEQIRDTRGGTVKEFLKSYIGKLEAFYVGRESTELLRKSQERDKNRVLNRKSSEISPETLEKKFKPLWIKAINAAIADIKGITVNMVKNGAFGKAGDKLDQIKKLERALEHIEEDSQHTAGIISMSVRLAVTMAASHYYPEETGNISRRWDGYASEHNDGVELLLKDISNGDTKKLGTVLAFFKQGLMTI